MIDEAVSVIIGLENLKYRWNFYKKKGNWAKVLEINELIIDFIQDAIRENPELQESLDGTWHFYSSQTEALQSKTELFSKQEYRDAMERLDLENRNAEAIERSTTLAMHLINKNNELINQVCVSSDENSSMQSSQTSADTQTTNASSSIPVPKISTLEEFKACNSTLKTVVSDLCKTIDILKKQNEYLRRENYELRTVKKKPMDYQTSELAEKVSKEAPIKTPLVKPPLQPIPEKVNAKENIVDAAAPQSPAKKASEELPPLETPEMDFIQDQIKRKAERDKKRDQMRLQRSMAMTSDQSDINENRSFRKRCYSNPTMPRVDEN